MTLKRYLILAVLLAWFGKDGYSQGTTCSQAGSFSTATNGSTINNRLTNTPACVQWRLTYFSTGFTALSIEIDGAPDVGGSPGSFAAVGSSNIGQGSNPSTTLQGEVLMQTYYPWLRIAVTSVTGSGTITYNFAGVNYSVMNGRGNPGGGSGGGAVTSVFARVGAVTAQSGDYDTSLVPELTNLYYTDVRARLALSGASPISYNSSTGGISCPSCLTSITGQGSGITVYSSDSPTTSGTRYFPPGGGIANSTIESEVQGLVVSPTTISSMGVTLSAALGAGKSIAFTWRKNASDTSVTCTISGASDTSCFDAVNSFTASQGDLVNVKAVNSNTYTGSITISTVWGSPTIAPFYQTVQQSGSDLTQRPKVNFAGAGVSCVDNAGATRTDCTIAGSSGGSTVTYGPIASRPSPSTAGAVYVPSDSYYSMLFDSGSAWVYRGMDGQTVTPPDSSLFTAVNSPTVSVQTNGGITISSAAASGDNIRSYVLTTYPTPPFTRTFRIKSNIFSSAGGNVCSATFIESGTGKLILLATAGTNFAVSKYTNATTLSGGAINAGFIASVVYSTFRLSDAGVGGNITFAVSVDGINFTQLFTEARNTFFTTGPNQIGISTDSNNANFASVCTLVSVD